MSDRDDAAAIHPRASDAAHHLELPLVPPEVSSRLRATFHASVPVVAAELVTDTRSGGALVGVRGGAAAAWSMSYRAGPCDILFDLEPHESMIGLNGQLLCPEPTSDGIVRVFRDDELVTAGSTDEFGQFELGDLAPGVYTVTVARDAHVIEMPVDLGPRT